MNKMEYEYIRESFFEYIGGDIYTEKLLSKKPKVYDSVKRRMKAGLSEKEAIDFFKKTSKKFSSKRMLNGTGKSKLRHITVDSQFSSDMFNANGLAVMNSGAYRKFLNQSNDGRDPNFDALMAQNQLIMMQIQQDDQARQQDQNNEALRHQEMVQQMQMMNGEM